MRSAGSSMPLIVTGEPGDDRESSEHNTRSLQWGRNTAGRKRCRCRESAAREHGMQSAGRDNRRGRGGAAAERNRPRASGLRAGGDARGRDGARRNARTRMDRTGRRRCRQPSTKRLLTRACSDPSPHGAFSRLGGSCERIDAYLAEVVPTLGASAARRSQFAKRAGERAAAHSEGRMGPSV